MGMYNLIFFSMSFNPCFDGKNSWGIYKNYGGNYSFNPCFNGIVLGCFLFLVCIESPAFASQPHPALCELRPHFARLLLCRCFEFWISKFPCFDGKNGMCIFLKYQWFLEYLSSWQSEAMEGSLSSLFFEILHFAQNDKTKFCYRRVLL